MSQVSEAACNATLQSYQCANATMLQDDCRQSYILDKMIVAVYSMLDSCIARHATAVAKELYEFGLQQ